MTCSGLHIYNISHKVMGIRWLKSVKVFMSSCGEKVIFPLSLKGKGKPSGEVICDVHYLWNAIVLQIRFKQCGVHQCMQTSEGKYVERFLPLPTSFLLPTSKACRCFLLLFILLFLFGCDPYSQLILFCQTLLFLSLWSCALTLAIMNMALLFC